MYNLCTNLMQLCRKLNTQHKELERVGFCVNCPSALRGICSAFLVMTAWCVSLQSFHDIAYFAEDRQDLLNGMNEFLDCSIVIPPSDVAGKDLLKTVVDFQKQLLAKKKERDLQRQSSLGLEDHGGLHVAFCFT